MVFEGLSFGENLMKIADTRFNDYIYLNDINIFITRFNRHDEKPKY